MTADWRSACLLAFALLNPPVVSAEATPVTCAGEWRVDSRADGAKITYQMFAPESANGRAIVIVHGSGQSSRSNAWYARLSQDLLQHGYLVALPDKRGSGRSAGDWKTASFETLAGDTSAVIFDLSNRCALDFRNVGVVGVSQGGQITAIVAKDHPQLGFAVNLVGSTTPLHAALKHEERNNLTGRGVPKWLARPGAAISAWTLRTFRQRRFWKAVGNFDPASYWKNVQVTSRVVLAELDRNTPTEESARIIRSLGNPRVTVEVIPGVAHDLVIVDEAGAPRMHPRVLEIIDDLARVR
ncbi:MAG: alpha/beta fold hydrolase [Lysobacterales bacterium]|nr:alpha/beta fold hydrolase [Xanthomonadales bacterium]MCB1613898.1 alpha/beta fold hydrolase [Xanthomonadales bacterium]